MKWIAPTEKDTGQATLEKRLWDSADQFRANSGLILGITRAEVRRAASDQAFRLMVVTQARTRNARVHEFRGRDIKRRFDLTAVTYFAEMR